MHASRIRRHMGHRWTGFTKLATLAIVGEAGYEVQRRYAGQTVASRTAQLGFKQGGAIRTVFVDIGDRVKAGQVLAILDDDSLHAALQQARAVVALSTANVQAVIAQTQLARNTERRFKELLAKGHVSQQQYDEQALTRKAQSAKLDVARAEVARAESQQASAEVVLREAQIIAPFAGVIQARNFDEGSQVASGIPLLQLVETTNAEAHIGIPHTTTKDLRARQRYPLLQDGLTMTGSLVAVLPGVDPSTRTQMAVFVLDESNEVPLGAVIELQLMVRVAQAGFWVPISALAESDRGLWGLYVVNARAQSERRLV